MVINGFKSRFSAMMLVAIMVIASASPVMASTTTKVARTRAWDTIETLSGTPKSVKKIEYAGSVFYLGNDVTEANFLTVIATGPEAVRMQTAVEGKLYSYPVYILWNKDKTALLVHPIVYEYDDVLEEISVATAIPTTLKETNADAKSTSQVKTTLLSKEETKKEIQKSDEKTKKTIFFEEVTLLSSDELKALVEIAPTHLETKSAVTMTKTEMTDAEITAWGNEYLELGGINSFELEVVRLINEERAKHKLQPLAIMPHYMQAARMRSQEMWDLSYMAHTSPVYGERGVFVAFFGRNMGSSEVVTGKGTPKDTLNAWLISTKGHKEIILSKTASAIGLGYVGNDKAGRTTALLIDGDSQYVGHEITINEYLNGAK